MATTSTYKNPTPPGIATLAYAPPKIQKSLATAIFDSAQTVSNAAGAFDRNTAAYAKSFLPALQTVDNFFASADTTTNNINKDVNNLYKSVLETVKKETNGFSEHVGAILGGLDGIARDPLNPKNLSNMATTIMERVSPGSSQKLNNSMQNLQLDKLSKAPALLFSSIHRLARGIDNLLSIPIAFISSIYNGLINLMKRIGKLMNDLIQGFQDFLLSFLDSIIPIKQVMQLLNDIGTLAGQIQGIASVFQGVNVVSGYALQLNTFTTQINQALANPLDTVINYLPANITNSYSQIIYNAQNPQTIINQALPPQLSQIFAKVSSITGYGFNGNMGYGVASVLQGMQGGVITNILNNFAAQYKILGPLLAGGTPIEPESYQPETDNGYAYGNRYAFKPDTEPYSVTPGRQ